MDRGTGRPSNKQEIEQEESVLTGGGYPNIFSSGTNLGNIEGF